jgi:hypothetical protein
MSGDFDVRDAIRRQRRTRLKPADAAIARLAARQHGITTRLQLVAIGLSARAVDRRIAAGRVHPIHRGVYAVGHVRLTREGRWMAAVLAGGGDAVLSHQAAGAVQGFVAYSGRAHVTVPKARRHVQGIIWHSALLPVDEVERLDGIPITTPARTLLNLAATLDRHRLERAIDRAEAMRLASPTSVPALVERHRGRRGVATLRAIIDEGRIGLAVTRSEFEDRFLAFIDEEGLPRPQTNVWLQIVGRWIEVDCVWREARLVVELDGRAFHDTAAAFEADRARDRAMIAAGWRVIRVAWKQLTREPAALAADLRAALRPR